MTQASPAVVKIPTTGAGERREALGEGEEGPPLGPEPGPRQRERPRGHSRRRVRGNQQLQSLAPRFRYHAEQSRGSARSAQFRCGWRGCRRCNMASWWRRIKISAVCHAFSRRDSRNHAVTRVMRWKANCRPMTGDHHGPGVGRATLLVRAVDAILGTHRSLGLVPRGVGEVAGVVSHAPIRRLP